ncbi:putative protein kinase [Trypanosoma grayi]|uniref:putative protein kinase n=1 Tax=Trypanosoma grayi TaxID=71804 RepID=UPI0004F46212|nr:putative protein kinase [Trypanosoma grayi]KEG12090.1 putative protein kinase [Trypanosoma grayi]
MPAPAARLSMSSFEVIKVVGEGTYGVVLQCRCKKTGDIVAVKRFKEAILDEYGHRVMLRELRVLNLLRGEQNVVQLVDAFREKRQLCLVMEYVSGTLLDIIRKRPSGVPLPHLRRLLYTLLLGLRSCHRNGIIHRDVKPENTLVRNGHTVVLCDFGSSRTIQPPLSLTTTSGGLLQAPQWKQPALTEYVATRWYRSPEMLLGMQNYSFTSDMWAAGAIMAELALGEPLLPGRSEMDQLMLIRQRIGEFPPSLMDNIGSKSSMHTTLARLNHRFGRKADATEDFIGNRYGQVLGENGLHLLRSLLTIDWSKRCTVDEALCHTFFDGLVLDDVLPQTKLGVGEAARESAGVVRAEGKTNTFKRNCKERDKWFGVGEGIPVLLQEIEPLHGQGMVEPRTPEVLAVEALAPPIALSTSARETDTTANCATSSPCSSTDDYSPDDRRWNDATPARIPSVQLPSIPSKSAFGLGGASPASPSLNFPSAKGISVAVKPLSHSPKQVQIPLPCSCLSQLRCPHNMSQRAVAPEKYISSSSYVNGGNSGLVYVNKAPCLRLSAFLRPPMKKKGRLVFSSRLSLERL